MALLLLLVDWKDEDTTAVLLSCTAAPFGVLNSRNYIKCLANRGRATVLLADRLQVDCWVIVYLRILTKWHLLQKGMWHILWQLDVIGRMSCLILIHAEFKWNLNNSNFAQNAWQVLIFWFQFSTSLDLFPCPHLLSHLHLVNRIF